MKVLITTDNKSGAWTFSINLAKGLISNGINVALAIMGDPLTDDQKTEVSFVSYYNFNCKQEWMADPWDDVKKAGKWLLNLKHQIQPDIVHLNSYSFGSLPWNIPVVITAHSCRLSWWKAVKGAEAPAVWDTYKEFVSKGIQAADVIAAPSNTMLNDIEELYEPLKKKVVIYNGGDSSRYNVEEKENYIFSICRLWDEAKNIKLVIKAASKISYPIYIAGDIADYDLPELPHNVHLLGRLSRAEVAGWLSKAAVYLLPVKYEPFGYTFIEAAFSGCALVTGNIESMREIWEDNALYVDTNNSDELAYSVNMVMWDVHRRQLLARNAKKHAISNYIHYKMTSEYLFIYQSLSEALAVNNLKLQER